MKLTVIYSKVGELVFWLWCHPWREGVGDREDLKRMQTLTEGGGARDTMTRQNGRRVHHLPKLLKLGKILFEEWADLGEQSHQMLV